MRLFLLAAALTALSPAALAQKPATVSVNPAPATLDTARKLLSMVRVDDTIALMFSKLMPLMVNATVTGLEAHSSTSELMKTMEGSRPDGRERLNAIFEEEFSAMLKTASTNLIDGTAQEYAANFSEAELNELITFYSGGTGKKFLTLAPELQQKMTAYGEEMGKSIGTAAGRKAMERAMKELLPPQKEPKA